MSISRKNLHGTHSQYAIVAFKRVVAPARVIFGVDSLEVSPRSGWAQNDANAIDPVEVALAERPLVRRRGQLDHGPRRRGHGPRNGVDGPTDHVEEVNMGIIIVACTPCAFIFLHFF